MAFPALFRETTRNVAGVYRCIVQICRLGALHNFVHAASTKCSSINLKALYDLYSIQLDLCLKVLTRQPTTILLIRWVGSWRECKKSCRRLIKGRVASLKEVERVLTGCRSRQYQYLNSFRHAPMNTHAERPGLYSPSLAPFRKARDFKRMKVSTLS